ncbi:MAG: hypothetical protein ABI268_07385 [Rhodanobacter sp.]
MRECTDGIIGCLGKGRGGMSKLAGHAHPLPAEMETRRLRAQNDLFDAA